MRDVDTPIGTRFSMLVTTGDAYYRDYETVRGRRKCAVAPVLCDCGTEKVVSVYSMRHGETVSCGCHRHKGRPKHGGFGTPEYMVWANMIRRCEDEDAQGYKDYGARGISVCPLWRQSFPAFLADIGPRPGPEFSIDRINNEGNYEPGNVRWATTVQQCNNRRSSRMVTIGDASHSVAEWSRITGVAQSTIKNRIRRGWSGDSLIRPHIGTVEITKKNG